MSRGGPWIVGALLVLCSTPARAQAPAGGSWPAPAIGDTELALSSDEDGLLISLAAAGDAGRVWGGLPGSADDESRPLCRTPCRIVLPAGRYTLWAGSYEFEVVAMGGRQQWYVEEPNWWMFLGGVTLTGLGAAGLMFGGIFYGLAYADDPTNEGMLLGGKIGLGIGVPLTVLGAFLWAWSTGTAELLAPAPSPAATPAATGMIFPTLAALPGPAGETAWGLQLLAVF